MVSVLPARYIIHTVGPVWHGGLQGEANLLASSYQRSLELADANAIKTLAFPSISTGIYGYPIEEAVKVAVAAIRRFLTNPTGIREVIFCCFSQSDLRAYERQLEELRCSDS
jgi:O-acetyl-ADP-ribose deacetylase (regulator of RNase III)